MESINQSINTSINQSTLGQVGTYTYLPARLSKSRQLLSQLPIQEPTYLGGIIRPSPSLSLHQHVSMSHPTKQSVGRLTTPLRARVEDREG